MNTTHHATHFPATTSNVYFTRSYAKINLTLDVLGKRSDGYHELATVMQTIDLYDTLCLTAIPEDRVSMMCNRADLSNGDNLVVKAAQSVRHKLGLSQGVHIELQKRVPVAAGLGGGSSNAAAVLLALRQWWQLPLSDEDLWSIASTLGSDVPFFLTGGLALCEGRGEVITPLTPCWPKAMRWLLLVKPAIGVSTATVFRNLTPTDYSDGSPSRNIQNSLQARTAFTADACFNSLERGVLAVYPEVAQARDAILQAGAAHVRLSGSGPTLFSTFGDLNQAALVQQQLQASGYEVYLTRAIFPTNEMVEFF